jgi:hypothetical protein
VKYRLEATRVTADTDAKMVAPLSLDVTCKTMLVIERLTSAELYFQPDLNLSTPRRYSPDSS